MVSSAEIKRQLYAEQKRRYGCNIYISKNPSGMAGVTGFNPLTRKVLPRNSKKPVTLPKLSCLEDK